MRKHVVYTNTRPQLSARRQAYFGKGLSHIPPFGKGGKGDLKKKMSFLYKISPNPSLPKRGNKREALPKRRNRHSVAEHSAEDSA